MPPATALQNSDYLSTPREPVCSSYCSRFKYQALANQMAVTAHNLLALSRQKYDRELPTLPRLRFLRQIWVFLLQAEVLGFLS